MFIHYGLYSQLGKGEWVQLKDTVPFKEYIKLKDSFTAAGFDADFIVKLAKKAGMKYITITSKHHEGFCLFRTKETDYNSVNSPAHPTTPRLQRGVSCCEFVTQIQLHPLT